MEVAAQDQSVPAGWEVVPAAPPPDQLLQRAKAAAAAGDLEAANAAFFQIPAEERKQRGVYAGPGGGDATGSGALALAGGAGVSKIIGAAVGGGGSSIAGRVLAGAKETVTQASPIVKYEAIRRTLEWFKVPPLIAEPTAMILAGYRRGENGVFRPKAPTAAEAAPAAARAEIPAAAARPPARAATAAPAATAVPAETGQILKALLQEGVTKDELNEALRLIQQNVDSKTIWARIQATRKLQGKPAFAKLPSTAEVDAAVKTMNDTGKWPE